jgi:hypothetical protein
MPMAPSYIKPSWQKTLSVMILLARMAMPTYRRFTATPKLELLSGNWSMRILVPWKISSDCAGLAWMSRARLLSCDTAEISAV